MLESISAQPASAAELPAHLIRTEKLNDSISYYGSSIHFKAEVTLKVGECTKDALSLSLGESTCMCIYWGKMPIGDLRKKVACCWHGLTCVYYFVIISIIWIIMLATVQFFVDMIIASFLCDNCCFKFLVDQSALVMGPNSLIFAINLPCYIKGILSMISSPFSFDSA